MIYCTVDNEYNATTMSSIWQRRRVYYDNKQILQRGIDICYYKSYYNYHLAGLNAIVALKQRRLTEAFREQFYTKSCMLNKPALV